MLKAVTFDLDQTLIDRSAMFSDFINDQYDRFRDELLPVTKEDYLRCLNEYDNNGYTEKAELFSRSCAALGLKIEPKVLLEDFRANYGQHPVLFVDTLEILEFLKSKYPLGLITNGSSKGQNAKIDNSGLRPYFETIKISEEEGIKKPDPGIFESCVADLGLKAHECVYIGDHPHKDVQAARDCGLKGIWVKNSRFEPPACYDGVIERLAELPELLAQLGAQ